MPSIVTHYFHTSEVAGKLPQALRSIATRYKDEFLQGGQGADLLFALFYDKTDYPRWGAEFHAKLNKESFVALGEFARADKSGRALAYGLGMICHYALDRTIHPYVNFMSRTVVPKFCDKYYSASTIHLRFEACLDSYLMQSKERLNTRLAYAGKYLPQNKEMLEMLDRLYVEVFAPLYGYKLEKGRITKAIKQYKQFANITSSYTGLKFRFFSAVEPILTKRKLIASYFRPTKLDKEMDCANLTKREFPKVIGEELTTDESFDELIVRAVGEAIILANDFYRFVVDGIPLENDFSLNYAGSRIECIKI